MNIILAKSAGFCFGVQRAVDTVYEQIGKNDGSKRIYTFGPIIHNEEVIRDLKKSGVEKIESIEDLESISGQILIIRSHGVKKEVCERAAENGIEVIDATCPFVKKIHGIVERESREGSQIVIIGDISHPEVEGIVGWAEGDVFAVKDEEEAKNLSLDSKKKTIIVSQTTFNAKKFNKIVEIIKQKGYYVSVINTICNATMTRQKEAEAISKEVDTMLVIGDRHSSNTQKLYDICRSHCADTYYIQTINDLNDENLQSGISVGITAGASTPNNIIQEVFLTCQKKKISTR